MHSRLAVLVSGALLGLARLALAHPGAGIVITDDGTIYFAYGPGHRIWKVEPDGAASELVIGGLDSEFRVPHSLYLDDQGRLITASDAGSIVWRITPAGEKTRIYPPDRWDGAGDVALGGDPFALTADGRIISLARDEGRTHCRLVVISLDGRVTPLAGGEMGFKDGTGPEARIGDLHLSGFAWGPDGRLYFTDRGSAVRRVTMNGEVTTVAGSEESGLSNGRASEARFRAAIGLTVAPDGTIYVADSGNCCIRMISPEGAVSTFAGTGTPGGSDGPADEAAFDQPVGITRAADGALYVLEVPHGPDGEFVRIRRIGIDRRVTTHAVIGADRVAG